MNGGMGPTGMFVPPGTNAQTFLNNLTRTQPIPAGAASPQQPAQAGGGQLQQPAQPIFPYYGYGDGGFRPQAMVQSPYQGSGNVNQNKPYWS